MKHHHLSPSKFPAWKTCPAFESDSAERKDAGEGTRQHAALANILDGKESKDPSLPPDTMETVKWAADYVRTLAEDHPMKIESRVTYATPDSFAPKGKSVVYHGTADAIVIKGNLADIADYKSGGDDRDHRPQLAGYALALFSMRPRLKTIRCHLLYGRLRKVDSWSLSQADAAGVVLPILDARNDPARQPVACDYCVFCARRTTCPALCEKVQVVADVDQNENLAELIREPTAITDPKVMSKALTLARHVSIWADGVRKTATEMAKGGVPLPGYRLQERRGSREITDTKAALEQTGLNLDDFLDACKVSIPKLTAAYAKSRDIPKRQAGEELESAINGIVSERHPSLSLVVKRN
jgi:hypothetical protein